MIDIFTHLIRRNYFFSCGFMAQSNSEFTDKLYIFTNVALDKDKINLRWKKTLKITQIEKKQKNVQEYLKCVFYCPDILGVKNHCLFQRGKIAVT